MAGKKARGLETMAGREARGLVTMTGREARGLVTMTGKKARSWSIFKYMLPLVFELTFNAFCT